MRTVADPDEQQAMDLPELREAAATSLKACAATIMHTSLTARSSRTRLD
jgi:hypothetical protein